MKKLLLLLALLPIITFGAGLTLPQGGLGTTTIPTGWIMLGLNPNRITATSSLFISPLGNVGIGTTSPSYKLDVMGGIASYGSSFFGGAVVATSTLNVSGLTTLGNASTTLLSASYASSTLWYGGGMQTCNATTEKLTWANGVFACGTDYNTGGTAVNGFDFTYATDIGYGITGSATTTKTQFTLGLHASSTSHFAQASTTQLTVTGTGTSTVLMGNVKIGGNLQVDGNLEVSGGLWPLIIALIAAAMAAYTITFTNKTLSGATVQAGYLDLDIPASDHSATGNCTNAINSGYTAAAFDLVYLGTGGKWLEVDSDAVATCKGLLGIALEAKNDTEAMLVALPGSFVRDDTWNWTVGATLYAGETLGAIQEAIPTGADAIIKVVGFAVSGDVIFFNPSPDQQSTVA